MRTLNILNSTGDTKYIWDPADPAQCALARKTVAHLKLAGYIFFLTDGSPADEVTAGGGTLLVRRLEAEEVVAEPETIEAEPPKPEPDPEPVAPARRRSRLPENAPTPDQNVVAVRPLRGG